MADKRKAHQFGISAERIAALYLRLKCYRILAMRYRNTQGEIDILARRGKTLVAVEVKARHTLEACAESVPPWKQQKIARAMEGFLAGLGPAQPPNIRFDAIWVAPKRWPQHIQDAWRV